MQSGGSCITWHGDNDHTKTLIDDIGADAMKKAVLKIPKNLLPSGSYIFGLEVSNGISKSSANATVEVVNGDVPFVEIVAPDTEVPPYSSFVAIALVTGSKGTCVKWESVQKPGYAHLDLRGSKSNAKTCYKKDDVEKQPFYLSIPEGQLEPDLKYLFKVKSFSASGGRTGASTLIISTTSSLPSKPTLTVEPLNGSTGGQALSENYRISFDEPDDDEDESQLTYTFGWKQMRHVTFLHQSSSVDDNPSDFTTILPPGLNGKELGISVDICNEHGSCVMIETKVDVSPRNISKEELM